MTSGRTKVIVAVLVAVAGVGATAWSITSLQRRSSPPRTPRTDGSGRAPGGQAQGAGPHGAMDGLPEGERRVVHGGGDGPGVPVDPLPRGPFEFLSVASDAEFADVGEALQSQVADGTRGFTWIDTNRSDHKTAGSAARLALAAPARGIEAFNAAIAELKGDAAGGASEAELIVAMLQNAKVDLKHLRVKEATAARDGGAAPKPPVEGERPRAAMMMRVERSGDGPDEQEATLSIPLSALFPQTADEVKEGQKSIEIKCPARVPGVDVDDGRAEIGVVLVRERTSGVWQPVMYNLYSRDQQATAAKAKAVRAAREKQ